MTTYTIYVILDIMNVDVLTNTARAMVAHGKGIIAADESIDTCKKRFDAVGLECTEENRRLYRQIILTAPKIEQYVSGIILFDETIRQKNDEGIPFVDILTARGILPGIKVDTGTSALALHERESITNGLDGLRERLAEYATYGARFAKWRAVIAIDADIPSEACIKANALALAHYAALCQEAHIVPIVEPEVLMTGDHTIERCAEVTEHVLEETGEELSRQGVAIGGIILKPSMVIAGSNAANQSTPKEVADFTVRVLSATVPRELPGITFLSGGQSDEQATANLQAMNALGTHPWKLSFSYGRAIQNPALAIWASDTQENVAKAQEALLFRCKMNSLAAQGTYDASMEESRTY